MKFIGRYTRHSALKPFVFGAMPRNLATEKGTTSVSFFINVVLFGLKLVGGILGRSSALLADALNSLLDIVANAAVWIGIRIANRPPDDSHPYGHGHANTLSAVFVALLLVITGVYIGINAIYVIIYDQYETPGKIATIIAGLTIVVKEILYQWTIRVGRQTNSPAVIANAYDHRTDVYTSLGALFGIVVAQMGFPILDPIAGFFIGVLILWNALRLIRDNIHSLMSGAPDRKTLDKIYETAATHISVKQVRDIKVRSVGTKYIADLKIMVDGHLSVTEGHDIATDLTRCLLKHADNLQDAMIHVEPYETDSRKDNS